jgi:hypothetical protein
MKNDQVKYVSNDQYLENFLFSCRLEEFKDFITFKEEQKEKFLKYLSSFGFDTTDYENNDYEESRVYGDNEYDNYLLDLFCIEKGVKL